MTPPPIDPALIQEIRNRLAQHEALGNADWIAVYRRMLATLVGDSMTDDVVRFYGGPKDGEAVYFPPDFQTIPTSEVDGRLIPHFIEPTSGDGRYEFMPLMKRYEWAAGFSNDTL